MNGHHGHLPHRPSRSPFARRAFPHRHRIPGIAAIVVNVIVHECDSFKDFPEHCNANFRTCYMPFNSTGCGILPTFGGSPPFSGAKVPQPVLLNDLHRSSRCSKAVLRSGGIPQRQRFQGFGPVWQTIVRRSRLRHLRLMCSHFAMSNLSPKFISFIIRDIRFNNLPDPTDFATKRPFSPVSSQVQQMSFPRISDYQAFP